MKKIYSAERAPEMLFYDHTQNIGRNLKLWIAKKIVTPYFNDAGLIISFRVELDDSTARKLMGLKAFNQDSTSVGIRLK